MTCYSRSVAITSLQYNMYSIVNALISVELRVGANLAFATHGAVIIHTIKKHNTSLIVTQSTIIAQGKLKHSAQYKTNLV